jgi:hypothetical protein
MKAMTACRCALRCVGVVLAPSFGIRSALALAFTVAACGSNDPIGGEGGDPNPPDVMDGETASGNWDSNPETLYGDALAQDPCSACVIVECSAEYADACDSTCGNALECVDICTVNCGDAGGGVCNTPMGPFPSFADCVSHCYAVDGGPGFTRLLGDCLGPGGTCATACSR